MSIPAIPTPQSETEPKPRSFTIRVPMPLYVRLSDMAKAEGTDLNKKVNALILLALGEQTRVDDILVRLIKQGLPNDNAA